jgi:hypothetical protein
MTLTLLLAALAATPPPETAALEGLAADVAQKLAQHTPEPPLGLWVEESPRPLPRAFASLLAAELAAKNLAPVVIDAPDATTAEGLARESGVRTLARLTVVTDAARVVVMGDVISTWVNFWSGQVPTRSGPARVVAESRALDGSTALLAGVPTVGPAAPLELKVTLLAKLQALPAALAAVDLDGDGRPELLAVVGQELLALSAEGKVMSRLALSSLSPSERPIRDAYAVLGVASAPARVWVWSSHQARPELITWAAGALKASGAQDGLLLGALQVKPVPGINRLAPEVVWAGKPLTFPAPFVGESTLATLTLVNFGDGSASIVRGVPPTGRFTQVGAGATLADFNGDGTAELLVSSPRTFGDGDELRLLTATVVENAQGRAPPVTELPTLWSAPLARGRVIVATTVDLDADGKDEVILGTWVPDGTGELLVARRVGP